MRTLKFDIEPIFLENSCSGQNSVQTVPKWPEVRDALFSELAHYFFLLFCMKLGVYNYAHPRDL